MNKIAFWMVNLSPHNIAVANELVIKGFQVYIFYLFELNNERTSQGWQYEKNKNIQYIRVFNKIDLKKYVLDQLDDFKINIIQGITGNSYLGNIFKYIKSKRRSKVYIYMETINRNGILSILKKIKYSILLILVRKKFDKILYCGNNEFKEWLLSLPFLKKTNILEYGYYINSYDYDHLLKKNNLSYTKFRILFAGRNLRRKGLKKLIKAFLIEFKNDNDVELIVVGKNTDNKNFIKLKDKEKNIKFLGIIKRDELREMLIDIDCLIMPSSFEGFGVIALEAMLAGCLTIVTEKCGVSNWTRRYPGGFVILNNSLNQIRIGMRKAYHLGKISIKKRIQNINWAKKAYSPKIGSQKIISID